MVLVIKVNVISRKHSISWFERYKIDGVQ